MTKFKPLSLVLTGPSWVSLPANPFCIPSRTLCPTGQHVMLQAPYTYSSIRMKALSCGSEMFQWPPTSAQCHLLHEAFLIPRAEPPQEPLGEAAQVTCPALSPRYTVRSLLPAYGPLTDTWCLWGTGHPQKLCPWVTLPPVLRATLPSPRSQGLGSWRLRKRTKDPLNRDLLGPGWDKVWEMGMQGPCL